MFTLKQVSNDIYHIVLGEKSLSMLSRYKILNTCEEDLPSDASIKSVGDGTFLLDTPKRQVEVRVEKLEEGYTIQTKLSEKERLFGLGDISRESAMVRGIRANMTITNVTSYGPMTVLLSSDGWAFILNSTFPSVFDCDSDKTGFFTVSAEEGIPDFYLIRGSSLLELQAKVTQVIGRPCMLPKFAYGLTFVQNEELNTRSLLWDIKQLRDRNIPCDTMGLEPSWMQAKYDYSTSKKWNPHLFPLPSWEPENNSGEFTFFFPMRQMGMQLSLWLCTNYDHIWGEEQQIVEEESESFASNAVIQDHHLGRGKRMDKVTKIGESWFEHLKKFVDNGAAAFKLDGADQVVPFPDRLWGGKYTDAEVHNVNPVLLAKNMQNGFREYTDRRLLLYTSAAYIGTAKYAATWAGDTGGGPDTLVSLMNYAMCGHSNTSCDIDVNSKEAIHYGFLTPWAQYFCWANWRYPWFLSPELESCVQFYANLRSTLVPYIYTMAHKANKTGTSILRPLPLVYDETDRFDNVTNAYMLGDSLYVGAFDMDLKLPEGNWVDYFTGKVYSGDITYEIPEGRGGALFAKEGSVIVTMKPQKYILEREHDYVVKVFPGKAASFDLYEDDGFTCDYEKDLYATTRFAADAETDSGFTFTVSQREGSYPGRPDNGSDMVNNSIPKINPMAPCKDITVEIVGRCIADITCSGESVAFTVTDQSVSFTVPAELHENGKLCYSVKYAADKK